MQVTADNYVNGGMIFDVSGFFASNFTIGNATISVLGSHATPTPYAIGSIMYSGGSVNLSNTTIANIAVSVAQGGLYNYGFSFGSPIGNSFVNTTIANDDLSGPQTSTFVFYVLTGYSVALVNTIVASTNPATNCYAAITAHIISVYNDIDNGSSCGFSSPGDLQNVNPLVAPLANNGGKVETSALEPGSPAIGNGSSSFCLPRDARGVLRSPDFCDVGAYQGITPGYDLVGADGGVFVFNSDGIRGGFYGSLPSLGILPNAPVVGIVPTLSDKGYFLVAKDGGVFSFGTAPFLGSLPGIHVTPNQPIVGIVAANTDKGYYLVGQDGGVYAFGTVPFLGSLPGNHDAVNNVIGIAATPSGNGYWVVQATGTVTAFGSATSFTTLSTTSPVTAIAGTQTGGGYWLVTAKGGVYAYGNATKWGAGTLPALDVTPNDPIIGIVSTAATTGYYLIGRDGGVFSFGTAPYVGSLPGLNVHVNDIVGAVES